jgi:hypothetical protein
MLEERLVERIPQARFRLVGAFFLCAVGVKLLLASQAGSERYARARRAAIKQTPLDNN